MSLAMEAKEYWTLVSGYRKAASQVGKDFIVQIQIPTLALRSKNPRIVSQLSSIMSLEGISNEETESLDPSA
jgi:hypothetical protein